MLEENATIGVDPAKDQGSDTDSTFSSAIARRGCIEVGSNRQPGSIADKYRQTGNAEHHKRLVYCYLLLCLLHSGYSILCFLCVIPMTGGALPDFKISRSINMTAVTRYIDPPDISVIFKRENKWQDPTCAVRRLEDPTSNDFGLGGSRAWSPAFAAQFDPLPETRRWTLINDTHMDRPPTYWLDSISGSALEEPWGIRFDDKLAEPELKDNLLTAESCDLLTSCCEVSLDVPDNGTHKILGRGFLKKESLTNGTHAILGRGFLEVAFLIPIDGPLFSTSPDRRRSGSRFIALSFALIFNIVLLPLLLLLSLLPLRPLLPPLALLVSRNVQACNLDEFRSFRSRIFQKLEPRVAAGKKRVRWICSSCGRPLYDDFEEIQPGAIAKLQQDLNERYGNTKRRANSGSPVSSGNSQDGKSRNSKRSFGQWWSRWTSSGGRSPTLPLHQDQNPPSQDPDCPPEKVFLLLCIPHRKWATKLVHMDLRTLLSDQLFFEELQTQYKTMQGKWRPWFSLKQLARIEFVQFELHKNELVDIRMTNVLPPETRDDYRYRPVPPKYMPPVGENLLMHLYEHPEDADDDAFCLDRIPKKLRERLVRPQRNSEVGWGVHLNEGLNLKKMCIFGLLGLFFSASFGVIWSVKRADVQGGFGVAAFVMAALTFTIGIVQATLEPK